MAILCHEAPAYSATPLNKIFKIESVTHSSRQFKIMSGSFLISALKEMKDLTEKWQRQEDKKVQYWISLPQTF